LVVFAWIGEIVEKLTEKSNKKALEKYENMTEEERAKENKGALISVYIIFGLLAVAWIGIIFT
jgi:hypothetical protein